MLRELLRSIGVDVGLSDDSTEDQLVFFTNAILCLKTQGGMQGKVQREWFSNCGQMFLRPLVELIQPQVVVCLGERAWRSVTESFNRRTGSFAESVDNPTGIKMLDKTMAMAVYHCGVRVLNMHRNRERQFRDWQRIRKALN